MTSFQILVAGWCALAALAFVWLRFLAAPYGRHQRAGWGPSIPSRPAWVIMEAVSLLGAAAWFIHGGRLDDPARWIFVLLWEVHYLQRSLVYPFVARLQGRTMPVSIMLLSALFNTVNTAITGWDLYLSERAYGAAWLADPRFALGTLLFVAGMAVNIDSDRRLRALRPPGESGYRIPHGGLFRWVSCPNYLGEIIEWTGFALATWSLGGLAFAVWTFANLAPRARAHHAWYRATFPDYPGQRRALVPFLA